MSAALIARRRSFFEDWFIADRDPERVERLVTRVSDPRYAGVVLDASNEESIIAAIREHAITHVLNVVDPRFVMPIFNACAKTGANYIDSAMSLSRPHPSSPYTEPGVMLGDETTRQGRGRWAEDQEADSRPACGAAASGAGACMTWPASGTGPRT